MGTCYTVSDIFIFPYVCAEYSKVCSLLTVWGLGFLFVTIISMCSLLGVSVLPLMDKDFYKQLLTVLIGLAVGSLAASSLFHLIPQASNSCHYWSMTVA